MMSEGADMDLYEALAAKIAEYDSGSVGGEGLLLNRGPQSLRDAYQVREARARNWATVDTCEFRPPSTVTTCPVKYELSSAPK